MARPIVRAATGTVLVKRVLVNKFSIPDVSAADFDNPVRFDLIGGSEAQDEQIESTGGTTIGTDVATSPLYSRVIGLKLNMIVVGQGGEFVRWSLNKNNDNDESVADMNTFWHSSDDTDAAREIRQNQMAKGLLVVNADRLETRAKVFVRRQTLKRLGSLKEDDRLSMAFSKDATNTTCTVTVWGNIYVKANA